MWGRSSDNNSTVYCGGINNITEELIRNTFGVYGQIIGLHPFPDRGYAFVRFATKEAASPEFVKRQELLSKLSQEYALKMFEASQMIEFLISSNSNIAHHVWPLTHQPDPANGDCVVDAQTLSTISILLPYLNSNKNSIEVSVADIKTRLDDVESLVPKVDEVLGNMGLIVEGKSVESESFIKNAGIWSITCALTALLISMVL